LSDSGINLPSDQAAALGLSFTCRQCKATQSKTDSRIAALTDLYSEMVKEKSGFEGILKEIKEELKETREKLKETREDLSSLREAHGNLRESYEQLRVAHENLQFECASKISAVECTLEDKSKEVSAIQDFVG